MLLKAIRTNYYKLNLGSVCFSPLLPPPPYFKSPASAGGPPEVASSRFSNSASAPAGLRFSLRLEWYLRKAMLVLPPLLNTLQSLLVASQVYSCAVFPPASGPLHLLLLLAFT